MRFVPANSLREGMVVSQTLYGKNSEKLLIKGTVLTAKNIASVRRMMFPGLYIEDDVSRDIEIVNIIKDELRIKAINGVKKMFHKIGVENNSKSAANVIDSVRRTIDEITDSLMENKAVMVNMIDLKCYDNYTYAHSVNVAVLSLAIGINLGLPKDSLEKLGMSALLHDIGKLFVDSRILNKPEELSPQEFEVIEKHAKMGYDYIKERFKMPTQVYMGVIDHHERCDGTGYPNRKVTDEISLFGKIIAIADVYDALTSERPYRRAMSPSEAMEYIVGNSSVLFDPDITRIFMRKIAPYPVGTTVSLSNGWVGIVVENYEAFCLRPKVRIIQDENGEVEPFEVDLHKDYSLLNVVVENTCTV